MESTKTSASAIKKKDNEVVGMAVIVEENNEKSEATLYPYDSEEYDFGDGTTSDIENATLYYDWLVDSATTSHITNCRDLFLMYQSIPDLRIGGVGSTKTCAVGRGDINLISKGDGQKFIIKLHNVLHVPENKNNLFSLGRWEKDGRGFNVVDGVMALHLKDGTIITRGTKVRETLYKMKFKIAPAAANITSTFSSIEQLPM